MLSKQISNQIRRSFFNPLTTLKNIPKPRFQVINPQLCRKYFSTNNITKDTLLKQFKSEYSPIRKWKFIIVPWLTIYLAGYLFSVVTGAYSRLSRSTFSLKKWHPSSSSIPKTDQQWSKLRQEYINSPEGKIANPMIQMKDFKLLFYCKALGIYGAIIMLPFYYIPTIIFMFAGCFSPKMRNPLLLALALTGGTIASAKWLDNNTCKEEVKQLSEVRHLHVESFSLHLLLNSFLYGAAFWAFLTGIRGNPSKSFKSLKNVIAGAKQRKLIHMLTGLLLVPTLFTGYLIGVNGGGKVTRNSDDKILPKWMSDLTPIDNLLKNRQIGSFSHRNMGIVLGGLLALLGLKGVFMPLPLFARFSSLLLIAASSFQMYLGVRNMHESIPYDIGALHAGNALLVMSAILALMHGLRKPNKKYVEILIKQFIDKFGRKDAISKLEKMKAHKYVQKNLWMKQEAKGMKNSP